MLKIMFAWKSRFPFATSLSSQLKYLIFLLLLILIFDYVTSDDFEIQGNNLRGGHGTDNKTFLRIVMLHVRAYKKCLVLNQNI
jgi:hypothetical protein